MRRVQVTQGSILRGPADAEVRFARFPEHYKIKGMFFGRIVRVLGEAGYRPLEPLLVDPPRLGRYMPFADYPQVDYSRLCHAAAVHEWPSVPVPEAMRRLARLDFGEFASSTVGRVTLALTGELAESLSKLPDLYRMSLKGGRVSAEPSGDGVRVRFEDFYGWVDCYPIGTLEGVVHHYGREANIEGEIHDDRSATYEVRWR